MKQKRKLVPPMLILFLLVLISSAIFFFKRNSFVNVVDCHIIEINNSKVLLKRTLGTFDPSEYGLNVYYSISLKNWEKIKELANKQNINLDKSIRITFRGNKLFDLRKKKEGVYFNMRKVIDVKQTGIILLH